MNTAVLGANGFLGRNVCNSLLESGNTVWAVYNKQVDMIDDRCIKVPYNANKLSVTIDICFICIGGYDSTRSQFREQQDAIRSFLTKNKIRKIVYASSISVYGNHSDKIQIDSSFNNPSDYGLYKLADEFLISSFDEFAIVRFTYLFGAGMKCNSMIPRMVEKAVRERVITLYGTGERYNDYLHIDDATELFIKAGIGITNQTIIGASGLSVSNQEIARLIIERVDGCKIEMTRADYTPSFSFEITATRQLTGWEPKVRFKEGLFNYINYASTCLQ